MPIPAPVVGAVGFLSLVALFSILGGTGVFPNPHNERTTSELYEPVICVNGTIPDYSRLKCVVVPENVADFPSLRFKFNASACEERPIDYDHVTQLILNTSDGILTLENVSFGATILFKDVKIQGGFYPLPEPGWDESMRLKQGYVDGNLSNQLTFFIAECTGFILLVTEESDELIPPLAYIDLPGDQGTVTFMDVMNDFVLGFEINHTLGLQQFTEFATLGKFPFGNEYDCFVNCPSQQCYLADTEDHYLCNITFPCDMIIETSPGEKTCKLSSSCRKRCPFGCECTPFLEDSDPVCSCIVPPRVSCFVNLTAPLGATRTVCVCDTGFNDTVRPTGEETPYRNYRDTPPHCVDLNECQSGDNTCSDNAVCSNTVGSYECSCNSTFHGNGFLCATGNHSVCGTNATSNASLLVYEIIQANETAICVCKPPFLAYNTSNETICVFDD